MDGPDSFSGASSGEPPEKPTSYRSTGGALGGGLVLAAAAAGIIDLLINGVYNWRIGAVCVLVGALSVVFGLYPAAFADSHRLVIRNPFRRVVLPWPRVTDVAATLSMTVTAAEDRFTIWAIPVSLRAQQRARRAELRAARAASTGGTGSRGALWGQTGRPDYAATRGRDTRPEHVQAEEELRGRRDACLDDVATVGPVEARWTWSTVAALVVGVVLVVVAFAL